MKLFSKTVLMAFAFSAVSGVVAAAGESGAASGGATGGAEAGAGAGAGAATSFSDLDKNNNGYVDADEAEGVSGLDLKAADTDADGRLSRTEFEAAMQAGGAGSAPGGTAPGATSPGGSGSESGGSGMGGGGR